MQVPRIHILATALVMVLFYILNDLSWGRQLILLLNNLSVYKVEPWKTPEILIDSLSLFERSVFMIFANCSPFSDVRMGSSFMRLFPKNSNLVLQYWHHELLRVTEDIRLKLWRHGVFFKSRVLWNIYRNLISRTCINLSVVFQRQKYKAFYRWLRPSRHENNT